MSFLDLEHNPDLIRKCVKELGDQWITNAPLRVFFPQRFVGRDLAIVGSKNNIVGMVAIATETEYTFMSVPGMVVFGNGEMNEYTFDDMPYYGISYQRGDVLVESLDIVQDDSLLYEINDEFIARGKLPVYLDYKDLPFIFRHSKHFTGVTIGSNANTMDIFYSLMGRDSDDLQKQLRNNPATPTDRRILIPLRAISITADDPLTKMAGAYMEDGLEATLISTNKSMDKIEEIIRT